MARKDPVPARDLLPHVLARLGQTSRNGRALRTVWEAVVGELVSRHATLGELVDGTLTVVASSPEWVDALQGREAEILKRLAERIGQHSVRRLSFVASGPAEK